MAVPFYVPDEENHHHHNQQNGGSGSGGGGSISSPPSTPSSPQPQSGAPSVIQSPLQSPALSGEHLVQAFCEALYRCSIGGGTPPFPLPPPSPSCSPHANVAHHGGGDIFFPRSINTSRLPVRYNTMPLEEVHRYRPMSRSTEMTTPRRIRLTSTGDEDDDDECTSEHDSSLDDFNEHFYHLEVREQLQEFPGRVPTSRKKKKSSSSTTTTKEKPKEKSKEQCFSWPIVTAFVLAVGCGIFVSR